MILASFSIFMIAFVAIGIFSTFKSKKNNQDYLLASRNEKSWMIALSAVATNNSGYMFIGIIGYTYMNGLGVIWIFLPLIIGDFCASLFAFKNIRIASENNNALSFVETLAKWSGHEFKTLRLISSVILIVFLSIYAGAQFRAGGKAMYIIFGYGDKIGVLIGAVIVLIYCLFGGLRASIWTNTVQSAIMISSMGLLFFMALNFHGGSINFINSLKNIDANYLSLFPKNIIDNPYLALFLFCFGWFFGGFGIIGQPHIMTSFMSMSKPDQIKQIRIYYYSWYFVFYVLTILTGLISRVLIENHSGYDPELSLPLLTKLVLPDVFIGFVLAGIFSATMSTADSQILCCSATISNDLIKSKKHGYKISKLSTLFVAIFALTIALIDNQSVFSLVMYGWLALACSFTPVIVIYSIDKKPSEFLLISTMLVGLITMLIWRYFGYGDFLYEAGIAIPLALIYYFISKKLFLNK